MSPPLTLYGPDPTRNPLTSARFRRGWSQGDLARRAGLARETVCRLERGYETPSWRTAAALAQSLGLEPLALFPLNDERPAVRPGVVTTSAGQSRHGGA